MVDILGKIDDIRNKPEHIRRRFVWLFVFISMVVIMGIWILSMKNNLTGAKSIKNKDKLEMMESLQGKGKNLTYPQPPNQVKSLLEDAGSATGLR